MKHPESSLALHLRRDIRRRAVWALLLAAAAYRMIGLGFGEMQPWDEGLYALRSLCAIEHGAFWDQAACMPGGPYYVAHPPLYVWITTGWLMLCGNAVWVFRLTSALAGAGLVLVFSKGLKRMQFGDAAALFATVFLAFNPLLTWFSRQGQLDMLLAFLMVSCFFLCRSWLEQPAAWKLAAAGVTLGLALMTKFLFALSIPAAFIVSGMFATREHRRAYWKLGVLTFTISLPVWIPWLASFIAAHGHGDPLFMFSASMPFGGTLAGAEGTVKDTGALFYLNQLVIDGSFLFPLLVPAFSKAIRTRGRLLPPAVFAILYLIAISLMRSQFSAYLVPLTPFLIMLCASVFDALPAMSPGGQRALFVSMVACGGWSASPAARVAAKSIAATGVTPPIVIMAGGVAIVAALGILALRRSDPARVWRVILGTACLAMAVTTCIRIWGIDPIAFDDGAQDAADAALATPAGSFIIIGNNENPQLSYYLDGADLGWNESQPAPWRRIEPRNTPPDSIIRVITGLRHAADVGVIIEKDDAGALAPAMLPPERVELVDTRGYELFLIHRK